MLGWEFVVLRRKEGSEDEVVCRWETGLGGMNWVEEGAKAARVLDLGGDGYPNRIVASAGVLLGTLTKGLPKPDGPLVIGDDYVREFGWTSRITWCNQAALFGDPAELFLIEAWDLS
mgnify:CR=1 FL=1